MSTLEVSGLFQDARAVVPGSVFVAVRGQKFDGHNFIKEAVQRGASTLVVENKTQIPQAFEGFILEVPDSRKVLDILASRFYWDPGQELFCVGVTGTNGKTSITYLIESIRLNRISLNRLIKIFLFEFIFMNSFFFCVVWET